MAKQIQEILIDDLDGGEANETVSFAIDGASYEIDHSDVNAKKLRDALSPFVQHARRAGAVTTRRRGRGGQRACCTKGERASLSFLALTSLRSIS